MNHLRDNIKFITINEYVDVETGEIITKSLAEREYYETGKKNKTITNNEKYTIITYTKECRRNGQQTINFT